MSKLTIDDVLGRGVVEIIPRDDLSHKLSSKKKLRIKYGIDPTGDVLHVGHSVLLLKLREFQDLGHTIIFLIGDFTTKIGDPTGRNKERTPITDAQIKKNMRTYVKQASLILDMDKVEVRYNSEWYGKMNFADFLSIASLVTFTQLSQRAEFKKRLKEGGEIFTHELMYPLLQGYDSVALMADLELGGTDQKFNLLMGRQLQERYGQDPQSILMTPILEGTDGSQKMSKSIGNLIAFTDTPNDMYGKVMSIPDDVLWKYFIYATRVSGKDIDTMCKQVKAGTLNPRDAKMALAREIVGMYHGEKKAVNAELNFIQIFQKQAAPEDMPVYKVKGSMTLIDVLVESGLCSSKTDARRQVEQRAVKIDGEVVADKEARLTGTKSGLVLQKGKRHFVKVVK